MNQCVCGGNSFETEIRKGLMTELSGNSIDQNIPVAVCNSCGLIRQIDLPFSTEEEYDEYYTKNYPPGHIEYIERNYASNLREAEKKFNCWKLSNAKRLLDVGCGSGALVDYCRKRDIEAYGCELVKYYYAPESQWVYYRKFENIYFPTDHFDHVFCCDVIEHVLNPKAFLAEIFRIMTIGGKCYIEIPVFFDHKDSYTHWKRIEHLWYFTLEHFKKLLGRVGFVNIQSEEILGAKFMFIVEKPVQNRISLLLPPGIGDAYWPLVKTQAFLKREGITPPVDAYVAAPRAKKYNSHTRAFPFLEMFPFLHSTNEVRFNHRDPTWREAYLQQGRSIFENVQGCDYFITWNGHLRVGKSLEESDPDLTCNWFLPRFISLKEENYRQASTTKYSNYLVMYWSFMGTGRTLFRHFTIEQIAAFVEAIVKATGLTPILVGAIWDMDDLELEKLRYRLPKSTIDLRGKTNIEEVFGLLRGAKAVIGMNSGITIMSAVFGIKTILLYHEYLFSNAVHRDFAWNTFPPVVRKKTYFPEFADIVTPEGFAARAISVINEIPYIEKKENIRKAGLPVMEIPQEVSEERYISIRNNVGISSPFQTTIACVLKTGGYFDERYVLNLKNMLDRNLTYPFKFICLTDLPEIKKIAIIKLSNGYSGWWSKIELFRPGLVGTERLLYFDLDTIILANIDDILTLENDFYALRPWNRQNFQMGWCASGIMSWKNGNYAFLYNEFNATEINRQGDQAYISHALKTHGNTFVALQDAIPGIYSYKLECRRRGLPHNARIICFHGRPRVHEVETPWVKENWK